MEITDRLIAGWTTGPLAPLKPWQVTAAASAQVRKLLQRLPSGYYCRDEVAIHETATVEAGAVIKGPAIIGPRSFIAASAYLRDGCWLEESCILGPGAELKSSFLFAGTKLAHFNFVGDSILGHQVNLEAGAIIANYRNEWPNPTITFFHEGARIATGVMKFGAVVGDETRIGANAVIAPGAILEAGTRVPRLALIDQSTPLR
ncbi:MAG TPA: hypothetical protein VKT70_05360 [Stellaceae bacterium]|nr:hypothetical protein [Stellaceae bacterium]